MDGIRWEPSLFSLFSGCLVHSYYYPLLFYFNLPYLIVLIYRDRSIQLTLNVRNTCVDCRETSKNYIFISGHGSMKPTILWPGNLKFTARTIIKILLSVAWRHKAHWWDLLYFQWSPIIKSHNLRQHEQCRAKPLPKYSYYILSRDTCILYHWPISTISKRK